ncbi:hypothetical protein ColTof3_09319 [Colletotrichum tofieldiae]|nr:hypothetical protein ColTof3_09319 [Colletotrichum tofieldiae]
MKHIRQAHQEFQVLASKEVPEDRPLGGAYQSMGEHPLVFNNWQGVEIHGPRATVTISPLESSLMFQSPSVALSTWNEESMTKYPSHNLTSDHLKGTLKGTEELSNLTNKPSMDQLINAEAAESQANLTCFRDQEEKKNSTTKPATTLITTTTGFDQGHSLLSPCQSPRERKVSENWSMLQNRHISRQCDEQMSTSTEDTSTKSAHQLANVKRRTEALLLKGGTQRQKAAIQTGAEKSSVKSLPGKELEEDRTENSVTSHMYTSTSPLNAQEEDTQRDQRKVASLGAARAAAASSGSKMAQTRKRGLPASEDFRALPLSLRKPHTDYVPFRRLRSSFNLVRRVDKSQQKLRSRSTEALETNTGQSLRLFSVRIGSNANQQTTGTANKAPSSASQITLKAGCSTSSTPVATGSEGGDIEGRLKREKFSKHVLKRATDGKQIAGILASWYWTVISPCFDPTSPARKRLDGNESTWADFGLFLFALSSGFMLLAVAVRIAQGIALLMQTVQGMLGGLIAMLGS